MCGSQPEYWTHSPLVLGINKSWLGQMSSAHQKIHLSTCGCVVVCKQRDTRLHHDPLAAKYMHLVTLTHGLRLNTRMKLIYPLNNNTDGHYFIVTASVFCGRVTHLDRGECIKKWSACLCCDEFHHIWVVCLVWQGWITFLCHPYLG